MAPSLYLQLIIAFLGTASVLAANPSVSAAQYATFVRHTAFCAASYADNCPTPPNGAVVTQYINVDSTDTQATVFRDDAAKEVILAWRGSSSVQDFVVDFNQTLINYNSIGSTACTGGCQVHGGYVDAWNSASSLAISAIQTQMSAHPGYALIVTGHSLGASLASLSAASLVTMTLGMSMTVYTFGQPRTGNPAYANYVDRVLPPGKMFRVTHWDDGVPQTISTADGYRHHSTEFWEDKDDDFSAADTVQCTGQEPPDCNNSVRGTGIGINATGINLAHIKYSGMSIGNPLDGGKEACGG